VLSSIASVHLPRIGHSTKGFNWYGTERLIRKHLATKGISTSMYPIPKVLIFHKNCLLVKTMNWSHKLFVSLWHLAWYVNRM